MNLVAVFVAIREFIAQLIEAGWRIFAGVVDLLAMLSPVQAAITFVILVSLFVGGALGMQRHLNAVFEEDAEAQLNPLALEARYSLMGYVVRVVRFMVLLPMRIMMAILDAFGSDDEDDEEEEPDPPLLVPALGPSYLWAGLITAGIAGLAWAAEPLIRWQIEAPAHFPTWQYLLFGHRAELGPYLPLDPYPYAGVLVVGALWLTIWWSIARVVRLWRWEQMGVNLIDGADDPEVLPSWRTHFGVTNLADRNASFDTWAVWLSVLAAPLLVVAFFAVGGDPYRVGPMGFSVACIMWLSWTLHLMLEGVYRPVPEEPEREEREPTEATAPGWTDVLVDLNRLYDLEPPQLAGPIRDVEPLAFSDESLEGSQLVSPLLAELLPEPQRLTTMQHDVLTELSRHSFVHLDPPGDNRKLQLGGDRRPRGTQMRHRNQIVIAPEGAGKTTLAMLASFNTALIHASSTLVVVRDEERAQRLADRMRNTVRPSTLRWNLRVRLVGDDLVEDLAGGVVPDVLVCDIDSLVTSLLDDVETFRRILKNLGVIIIDDLETLCGPVEVHAQLAFRRLDLRLRELRGVDEIGEEQAPIFLALAADTMDDLPAWARTLCGVDAVPRRFESQQAARRRQLARRARENVDNQGTVEVAGDDQRVCTADGRRRRQLIYDLEDFVDGDGKPLSLLDIVQACESLAVPWHYRPAGDDRRLLGRSVLPLRNEPQSYVDDPLKAGVVIVEGHASAVQREVDLLGRAGAEFSSKFTPASDDETDESLPEDVESEEVEPIAVITVVDPDERAALRGLDDDGLLAQLAVMLPRPFLRPPSGYLKRRHLAGELVQHWTEVADLLDIFGNDIASLLRELTKQGAVLTEQRTNLEPGHHGYENHVYVRGLEAELYGSDERSGEETLLPRPVEDVEVSSRRHVAVRERSTLVELFRVDAESARHRLYPGRIFETARGRHVVMEYADEQAAGDRGFQVGDIIAEPFLGPEVTSPRRDVRVELVADADEAMAPKPVFLGPAPVGVGLYAVRCGVEHRATFRLNPHTGEVRQRIFRPEEERRRATLRTVALGIHPNLEPEEPTDAPELTVGAARMVAAAFRAVIPLLYRGANEAIGIALHVEDADAGNADLLAPTDGMFLYDLHGGSNGAARALERDGVDALMGLSRHLLEELDDLRRLAAMHDEWDGELHEQQRRACRELALQWFEGRLGPSSGAKKNGTSEQPAELGEVEQ